MKVDPWAEYWFPLYRGYTIIIIIIIIIALPALRVSQTSWVGDWSGVFIIIIITIIVVVGQTGIRSDVPRRDNRLKSSVGHLSRFRKSLAVSTRRS